MIPALEVALSIPGVWLLWALLRQAPLRSLMADTADGGVEYVHLPDDWRGMV